jgi:V8-like Glu-specific endopeptidase
MSNVDLTTSEREALAQALQSAYFNPAELEQLVFFGLGEKLDNLAAPGALPARVMALIQWVEASGRTDEVVRVAYERRSGNPKLQRFFERYLASAQRQVTRDALERLTDSAVRLKNPVLWRDQMARAESCVCRVLVKGDPAGTGFLAGPGLVITNYHVVEQHQGSPIQVEFGYRIGTDGTAERGQRHDVTGPALFQRPYSAVDSQYPKTAVPAPEELDFAVLPVGGEPELALVDGRPRGTIAPAAPPRLSSGELVTIIQHPMGEPLQFAYDRVLEINANQTRVTYKVQTRQGSSGSPCFDADWNLVAVHHGADPRTGTALGDYNEGIPIAAVRASLPPEVVSKLGWGGRST